MPAKGKHRRPKSPRFTRSIAVAGTGGAALALPLGAQQTHDAEYTAKIREYTTEPFFLTELVDQLPASNKVPTPEKFLDWLKKAKSEALAAPAPGT